MHVFKPKKPISNSNTWNITLKLIKQWVNQVQFSAQLLFIMNAVNQEGGKKGSGVGGNSKSGRIPLITWHLSSMAVASYKRGYLHSNYDK